MGFNDNNDDEEECTDDSSEYESTGSSENATFEILKSLIKSKKKDKQHKKPKSRSYYSHSHKSMPSPSMSQMYPPYYPYPPQFHQSNPHIAELHQTLLKQIAYNKRRK